MTRIVRRRRSGRRSASGVAGRPLLLLHGFTGRGADWGAAAARARGGSRPRSSSTCWATAARTARRTPRAMPVERTGDDLATILGVTRTPRPPIVVGYSFGARVALRLAVDRPGCRPRARPREPLGRHRRAGRASTPPRRRRGAGRRHRARRDRGLRRHLVGDRSPCSRPSAACPPRRGRRFRAGSACATDPAGSPRRLRGAGQGAMDAAVRPPARRSPPRRS